MLCGSVRDDRADAERSPRDLERVRAVAPRRLVARIAPTTPATTSSGCSSSARRAVPSSGRRRRRETRRTTRPGPPTAIVAAIDGDGGEPDQSGSEPRRPAVALLVGEALAAAVRRSARARARRPRRRTRASANHAPARSRVADVWRSSTRPGCVEAHATTTSPGTTPGDEHQRAPRSGRAQSQSQSRTPSAATTMPAREYVSTSASSPRRGARTPPAAPAAACRRPAASHSASGNARAAMSASAFQ